MINKIKTWLHQDCISQAQSWKDKYKNIDLELVVIKGEREHLAKQLNETKHRLKQLEENLHHKTQVSSSKAAKITTLHEDHPLAGKPATFEDVYDLIRKSDKKMKSRGSQRRTKNNS